MAELPIAVEQFDKLCDDLEAAIEHQDRTSDDVIRCAPIPPADARAILDDIRKALAIENAIAVPGAHAYAYGRTHIVLEGLLTWIEQRDAATEAAALRESEEMFTESQRLDATRLRDNIAHVPALPGPQ